MLTNYALPQGTIDLESKCLDVLISKRQIQGMMIIKGFRFLGRDIHKYIWLRTLCWKWYGGSDWYFSSKSIVYYFLICGLFVAFSLKLASFRATMILYVALCDCGLVPLGLYWIVGMTYCIGTCWFWLLVAIIVAIICSIISSGSLFFILICSTILSSISCKCCCNYSFFKGLFFNLVCSSLRVVFILLLINRGSHFCFKSGQS